MSYSTDSVFQSGRNNLRFGGELSDDLLNTLTSSYGGSGSAAGQDLSRAWNFGQKFTGLGADSVANSFIGQIKANPNAGDVSFDFNPFEAGTGGFDNFSPYSNVNLNTLRNSGSAFGQDVGNRVTDFTNNWNPDTKTSDWTTTSGNTGGNNVAEPDETQDGYLDMPFNTKFNPGPTAGTGFNNTSTQTAYSPANQGMMDTQGFTNNAQQTAYAPANQGMMDTQGFNNSTQQTAYSPQNQGMMNKQGFNPTQTGANPYDPTGAVSNQGLSNLTNSAMPGQANPYQQQNQSLTQMSNAPNQSIYNTGGVQNDMNSYFQGGQQLPQIQAMMGEMQRQQQLEGQNLQEQMTNRGIGNSTLNDTAVQDLGARQRNEQMNLATNATMQLLPMQVQLAEQMRQGDMSQRGQQTQEMFGALGLQDQLSGSQFGRDLAGRQQGVSELMGALGMGEQLTQGQYGRGSDTARLNESLTQGQYGREAGMAQLQDQFTNSQLGRGQSIAQLNDQLTQSQFGRDATSAQLQDQFNNSAFGRGQSSAQLNEALTQGQYGRDAGTAQLQDQFTNSAFGRGQSQAQLNDQLTQSQFGRDAATAQLTDTLGGNQFARELAGRQSDYNEYQGNYDRLTGGIQQQFDNDITAQNSFSNALGRLMPQGVGTGGAPGPSAMEDFLSAVGTFAGMVP